MFLYEVKYHYRFTAPRVYRGLLTKAFPQQLVMEGHAEEMATADLNDQKSAGRWLGIKRTIQSTMKTWQVDTTANHLSPQKKEGVFGRKQMQNTYWSPIDHRQMLSCGKKFFEPTSPKWWWGAPIYQNSIDQQTDKWERGKEIQQK